MLLNRSSERRLLDRLLADVRAGQSRALVVRGEAGIGKTALLGDVLGRAADCWTLRAAGVESERELAFAVLHQVCAPILDRAGVLPAPQREALRIAFGVSAGSPPDRFVIGLAVLGLLAEAARERPLLCVIDDAQWVDHASAQVLAFAARRLRAESVAMIFAVRETPEHPELPELTGLPEMWVTGLPAVEARALLMSTYRGPMDERVLERVIAESQGNPLALLELPRGFTPTELAGGFGLGTVSLPRRIEESFQRQIATLPAATRDLLLVAAVEPVGDPGLVLRALERLGRGATVAGSLVAAAELVEFGSRVQFRHPLLRSAIYDAAPPDLRRDVHRALADVADPVVDPDRRAWHLAQAATGPDEEVAAELERRAGRAQTRGGLAAAATFLERAAELTPDPAQRGQRAFAAAQANHRAGIPAAAMRLLSVAEASPLGELERALADLLRAQLAFTMERTRETPTLLLKAAGMLEQLDVRAARDTYLDALRAAWFVAHLAGGTSIRDVATAARLSPEPAPPALPPDLLLDGLAVRHSDGYAAGAPRLREAVRAFRGPAVAADDGARWLWFATTTCLDLWEDEACAELAGSFVRRARESGELASLPMALTIRVVMLAFAGDLADAASLSEELEVVLEATQTQELPYARQVLAAWTGQESAAGELIAATTADAERRGEGIGLIAGGWMAALLYNSLGRYEDALAAAQQATEPRQDLGVMTWAPLVELVTAATRTGRRDLATGALERLTEMTRVSGTDWALGLEDACTALLLDGAEAEALYVASIERLGRTLIRGQLARAHLHYGEWLRRRDRVDEAREQLGTAHAMFTRMGMEGFADLTARELEAAGETVRKRPPESPTQLTSQEAQIVGLVRDRLSNAEIAGRLFISPRTVEWHLGNIFAKLQITSRRQLHKAPKRP